ncbi:endonuclease [Xanthomonas bromi]|uniref:Endonuclease n=1 Tax=Xanthomonas bromi TaxID=56449 RepID=A0A1C3NK14_9XANT|nr:endonuclease [Xanthomonas bromi]
MLAADALLDQTIFVGVGNINKNEVLQRIRPQRAVGARRQLRFLHLEKALVLKKHYQVHTKTSCPRDGAPLQYRKHLGKAACRAFFCEVCQRLYRAAEA